MKKNLERATLLQLVLNGQFINKKLTILIVHLLGLQFKKYFYLEIYTEVYK